MGIEGDKAIADVFKIPEKEYEPPAADGRGFSGGARARRPAAGVTRTSDGPG